jgi:hypothetical protein
MTRSIRPPAGLRAFLRLLAWGTGIWGAALGGWSQEDRGPEPVPREILCLYDSSEVKSVRLQESWVYAQLVLNHLGWHVRYHDHRTPFPPDGEMARIRGILWWISREKVARASEICRWLARERGLGRRLAVILPAGRLMEGDEPLPDEALGQLLGALGMEGGGAVPQRTSAYQIVTNDPRMAEFERKLDPYMPLPGRLRSVGKDNHVHLSVVRSEAPDRPIDLVVTGPGVACAYAPFVMYQDFRISRAQWRIDPFRFFDEAFQGKGLPRFDVTTRGGRRIFFSHVDGDGFENAVLDSEGQKEISATRFKREFLERYPLPVTVSVIASEMLKNASNRDIAREIFRLPSVEPAVHSYYHPLDWEKGTMTYDRLADHDFDYLKETRGAVEWVDQELLPRGRKIGLYLWSGSRNPPEGAIAALDAIGVENLNADDVFLDDSYPSYANVTPAYLPVGQRVQINARSSMEHLYTEYWTQHFWAFRKVLQTMERTGRPIRICPINLYHHFYIVERKTSREVLHEIYRWILSQPIHPITTGEYVQVVKGFMGGTLERTAEGAFVADHYGACRTLRFDGEARGVDLERSQGVLGFAHDDGNLYVHLAAGKARIVLAEAAPARPYLARTSGEAALTVREDGTLRVQFRGLGPTFFTLGAFPWEKASISYPGKDGRGVTERRSRTAEGELTFQSEAIVPGPFVLSPE